MEMDMEVLKEEAAAAAESGEPKPYTLNLNPKPYTLHPPSYTLIPEKEETAATVEAGENSQKVARYSFCYMA